VLFLVVTTSEDRIYTTYPCYALSLMPPGRFAGAADTGCVDCVVVWEKSAGRCVASISRSTFDFGLVAGSKLYLVGCNIGGVRVAQMELLPVKSYPLLATRIRTMNRIHLHIPLDFILL